jgi:hypothetical protein
MRNVEKEAMIFIPLLKQFCGDIVPLNLDKEFPSFSFLRQCLGMRIRQRKFSILEEIPTGRICQLI